jgi:hypothetical protein
LEKWETEMTENNDNFSWITTRMLCYR